MGWIHDTGYAPAYDHEGFVQAVLHDGSTPGAYSAETTGFRGEHVAGWRAGCACGWSGQQFYAAAEHQPGALGGAPPEVDGDLGDYGCFAEWAAHLAAALPALAVHDAVLAEIEAVAAVERAVAAAREAGTPWATIGGAAGITRQSAHERWRYAAGEAGDSR